MGDEHLIDEMLLYGLIDAFSGVHMGITAENICTEFNVSRKEMDQFALESQHRALQAIESGRFREEIVPVEVLTRKGSVIFHTDQQPRSDTTAEALAKLRPAFKPDGSVTAGNASGINDGAAALVVMSRQRAESQGLKPLATIRSYAAAAIEPRIMGMGPIPAIRLALKKADVKIEDIDLVEANEAFAAQAVAVGKELGFDRTKLNVNGGAIALGHPIGASGARILVTLLYEMQRQQARYGLATLCIGGGQGVALIVER